MAGAEDESWIFIFHRFQKGLAVAQSSLRFQVEILTPLLGASESGLDGVSKTRRERQKHCVR